ncbi:MAG: hypothetical protein V3T67_02615, partial [Nitrosopumilaceae archaeon]
KAEHIQKTIKEAIVFFLDITWTLQVRSYFIKLKSVIKTFEWLQKNETTKNPLEPYDVIS